MNTPLIFILFPLGFAALLFALQRYERLSRVLGVSAILLLLLLSWRLPINSPILPGVPGVRALLISDSLWLFGRRFVIDNALRPLLSLFYLAVSLWLLGSWIVQSRRSFIPLALAISALLVASMAVEPPLYSAMFIVFAALLSIPLFSPPGKPISTAALRLFIFQTVGMGLFLFADWFLSTLPIDPASLQLPQASAVIGLGLALMAGVFPFHSWIPMIARDSAPLPASFVIFFIPFAAAFLGLRYLLILNSYPTDLDYLAVLRSAGVLMIIAGGIWAATERHLGRMMAFAMLIQLGCWLLAFSMLNQVIQGVSLSGLFFALLLPQALALVAWSVSLELISQHRQGEPAERLLLPAVAGLGRRFPFLTSALLLANFSLAGLPLLASFPALLVISSQLTRVSAQLATLFWLGLAGLMIAGLRTLAVLTGETHSEQWVSEEIPAQVFWLILFSLALVILGLLPQLTWLGLPASGIFSILANRR